MFSRLLYVLVLSLTFPVLDHLPFFPLRSPNCFCNSEYPINFNWPVSHHCLSFQGPDVIFFDGVHCALGPISEESSFRTQPTLRNHSRCRRFWFPFFALSFNSRFPRFIGRGCFFRLQNGDLAALDFISLPFYSVSIQVLPTWSFSSVVVDFFQGIN